MARPTREIALFGTDEVVAPPVLLRAGPLTAELENGNLRYVRFGGHEMLRAVSYVVRDKNWGTYRPAITGLRIERHDDAFEVHYDAVTADADQRFRYTATITGRADGSLTFAAAGEAETDFLTDRTGFVVLHPIVGVSGEPCSVEYVDGTRLDTRFPRLIDPVQPMKNLRALTHGFAPGLHVTCRMEGDTFEMEDQRNWSDASYKTYVRPLALPWPYTLAEGERLDQKISLSVTGSAAVTERTGDAAIAIGFDTVAGATLPPLGFALDPIDFEETATVVDRLRAAGPHHLVVAHHPGRGHDGRSLARAVDLGRRIGGELWLEAVIVSIDDFEAEIAALGRTLRDLGAPFTTVLVSPAPDLDCTLPGSPWPPCPPLADVYRAARAAFPGVRLGGGTFAYFTELNRKRPPVDDLDLVSFTTIALMHAGDDRSATEGLEALPAIAASVRAFIGAKPYHVGPSAIGMRYNPYGVAPMPNPDNVRQAMNRMDPRQRGLFAAAWAVGWVSAFARGGASALTLGAGTGDLGLVHTRGATPKAWYDDHGGVYPVFHAFAGLAALAGGTRVDVLSSAPRDVHGVGAVVAGDTCVWLANLTGTAKVVELAPSTLRRVAILDEHGFVDAATRSDAIDALERPLTTTRLDLAPYAVARLRT